jgi:glutamate carboxypeptidase
VRGRAAHAGLEPEAGVSAIDELVDRLTELRALADPTLGTTITPGVISGGSASNVIAERAEAEIDVRVPTAAEEARVRAAFAALRAARPGAELEVTELHSRPALERTPAIAALAERARMLATTLGLELGEGSAGGVSDANLAAAEGVVVLDGIGPEGSGAHAIDERVSIDSLVERTALIALLIAEL